MPGLSGRARGLVGAFCRSNAFILFAGTALGQAMPILLSPVLTRLFPPREFGTLGVFSAVCMSLIPLVTMRYELALLLVKEAKDVAAVLTLNALAISAMTLIAALATMVFPWQDYPQLSDLYEVRAFLPVALLAIGTYQILVYEATRADRFRAIARTKLIQGFAGPFSQISFGLAGLGTVGLIGGFVISQSFGAAYLFRTLVAPRWAQLRATEFATLRRLARRHVRFPLLSSWSNVLQEAGTQYAAVVLMMTFFGTTIAGYLFLADRIVGRPLLMVSTSVLQSFSGELSRAIHEVSTEIRGKYLRVLAIQFGLNLIWCSAVYLAVPNFVVWLFGAAWGDAVVYIQTMCFIYLFQATMHPVYPTLQLLERQGTAAVFEVVRLIAVSAVIISTASLQTAPPTALAWYAVTQAGFQILLFLLQLTAINAAVEVARGERSRATASSNVERRPN